MFFETLSEKDRRLYCGLEAIRKGCHGVSEVSEFYGIHKHTVRTGKKELLSGKIAPCGDVRKKGGGRKKSQRGVDTDIVDHITRFYGRQSHESRYFMDKSKLFPYKRHVCSFGIKIGVYVVKQLLKSQGYVRRKLVKSKTMSVVANRDEQFRYIADLKQEFISQGYPVLSIDTKKKETIGDFYSESPVEVNDHDFNSLGEGTVVPHGIYDVYRDKCYLTLGTNKDTAEFVYDNLYYWWENRIKYYYPAAPRVLILCDGGGSNSCRHYVVKEAMHRLSLKLNVEITLAHYPAYCSK